MLCYFSSTYSCTRNVYSHARVRRRNGTLELRHDVSPTPRQKSSNCKSTYFLKDDFGSAYIFCVLSVGIFVHNECLLSRLISLRSIVLFKISKSKRNKL